MDGHKGARTHMDGGMDGGDGWREGWRDGWSEERCEVFIEVLVCSSVLLFSVAIFRSVAIQLFCVETCSTSVPTPAGQV